MKTVKVGMRTETVIKWKNGRKRSKWKTWKMRVREVITTSSKRHMSKGRRVRRPAAMCGNLGSSSKKISSKNSNDNANHSNRSPSSAHRARIMGLRQGVLVDFQKALALVPMLLGRDSIEITDCLTSSTVRSNSGSSSRSSSSSSPLDSISGQEGIPHHLGLVVRPVVKSNHSKDSHHHSKDSHHNSGHHNSESLK